MGGEDCKPIVGSQGTFGAANSLSLHFPHPRPRSDIHRHPETTPLQGRCGCGSLLGSVPRGAVGRPAVGTATAGLGVLLPGPTPTRCDSPSIRACPRVRGRCLGFRGVGQGYVWYFRTPHLQRGFPHAPPGGGIRLLCSFCYWCLGRCCCRWSRACCRCCCSARASCSTCLIAAVKAGERWYRPFFSIEINLLYFARSSSAQPVLSLRISTACHVRTFPRHTTKNQNTKRDDADYGRAHKRF